MEPLGHPTMELDRLLFKSSLFRVVRPTLRPVRAIHTCESLFGRYVQQDSRIRHQTAGRCVIKRMHIRKIETPAKTLVSERGIGVPVCHNDPPRIKRRTNYVLHKLSTRSLKQE